MIDFAKERRLSRAGKAAINGFYSAKAFRGGQPVYPDVSGWPTWKDFAEEKLFSRAGKAAINGFYSVKAFQDGQPVILKRIRMADTR